MAFLQSPKIRKFLLIIILAWGAGSLAWAKSDNLYLLITTLVLAALGLVFILTETSTVFLLLLLSFTSAFGFYIFLFQYNFPTWLVMLGVLIIFGYLFTYMEQKVGILGDKRLIYLLLFSISILEVFLTLNYFLIDPISQSLAIAAISYLIVGFCYTIIAKHEDNKFITYALMTGAVLVLVFLTSRWGGLV